MSPVRGLAPELYPMLLRGSSKDKQEKEPPKSSRATQKNSVIRGFGEPLQAKGGGEGGRQGPMVLAGPRHCVLAFSSSL